MKDYRKEAQDFLENAQQFRLGFLRSEARNPLTMNLDQDFVASSAQGVNTLLSCDTALLGLMRKVAESADFRRLTEAIQKCFARGGRIIFSGCGAAGRLSVLLESAWREAFPGDERVLSLLTGGDYALVRSVENFEDYEQTGALQVRDLGLTSDDLLIGITATGETTSTVGSAFEALERGAEVFMLICVDPTEPASRLARCKKLYSSPSVHVLSMPVGGMALTGSTRMQSSTMELLFAGAALEQAVFGENRIFDAYQEMLMALAAPKAVAALGQSVDFESDIFRQGGLIDYQAEDLLIDLLSDTTERSPTFMTPPYHCHDIQAPEPWAMVRHPNLSTPEAWHCCLGRAPRCINWSPEMYHNAGLDVLLRKGLPQISEEQLLKIQIGNEEIPARSNAFQGHIESDASGVRLASGAFIPAPSATVRFRLIDHLRMKLIMNTLSTGTMAKLGRIRSNYMIYLDLSNKKLIDRASRIISELSGLSYEEACEELFRTWSEIQPGVSPVAATLERLQERA
ncbi:MAG: hypothetical protein IKR81_13710 [Victivallales bacterium]|nr:hypothetical protein [Victivallales bacterium]